MLWNSYLINLILFQNRLLSAVQFSLVAQLCPTLCDPMDCSMPGFPVHHQLPEFTQTHVHWVGEAIQPSHPLSSPSPPAFNRSQHLRVFSMSQFFAQGGQSIGVSASASVLPVNIQDWSPLGWTGWISLQSKGLSIWLWRAPNSSLVASPAFPPVPGGWAPGSCRQLWSRTRAPKSSWASPGWKPLTQESLAVQVSSPHSALIPASFRWWWQGAVLVWL